MVLVGFSNQLGDWVVPQLIVFREGRLKVRTLKIVGVDCIRQKPLNVGIRGSIVCIISPLFNLGDKNPIDRTLIVGQRLYLRRYFSLFAIVEGFFAKWIGKADDISCIRIIDNDSPKSIPDLHVGDKHRAEHLKRSSFVHPEQITEVIGI